MRECDGMDGAGGVAGWVGLFPRGGPAGASGLWLAGRAFPCITTGWLWASWVMQTLPKLFVAVWRREAACFSCFWLVWLTWFWHVQTGFDCSLLSLIEGRGKLGNGVLFSSRFVNPCLAVTASTRLQRWVEEERRHVGGEGERRDVTCWSQRINTNFISQALCSKALKTHLGLACGVTPKMP